MHGANLYELGKVRKGLVFKNWKNKGKRRIQNTGKHTVNKLHKVACELLKCPETGYTSHTWRWSAATNLANAGVSFIHLKYHRQWISCSVVEGYTANSRPLGNERLHCLMPRGAGKVMVG